MRQSHRFAAFQTAGGFQPQRVLRFAFDALISAPSGIRIATILCNLLSLVLPLAISQVYDRILPNRSTETLFSLGLLVFAAILLEAILDDARNSVIARASMQFSKGVYSEAIARVMVGSPGDHLKTESASRLVDRLRALQSIAEWRGSPAHFALLDLPFAFLFLGMVWLVGGTLVIVPLAVLGIMGFVAKRRISQMRAANLARDQEDMKVHDFLVETFNAIGTVKAGAMEPLMERRFERLQESIARHNYNLCAISEDAQSDANLLANLMQVATVTLGAVLVIDAQMSVGSLACCVMLAGRASKPILRCVSFWTEIQSIAINFEKAEPILGLAPVEMPIETTPKAVPIAVSLRGIRLPRAASGTGLLNADFPAGSTTLLSGATGSGKSSLVDMLSGQVQPEEGRVVLDGEDLAMARTLKCRIAAIRPGTALFKGSILDNITNFRAKEAVDDALYAARLIGLDKDIALLPMGFETPIGDSGASEFPAGFVQRILIARALARRPDLLILDEAETGLDNAAVRDLAEGLTQLKGRVTMIIVSHRSGLSHIVDQAFELHHGVLTPCHVQASEPLLHHEGAT